MSIPVGVRGADGRASPCAAALHGCGAPGATAVGAVHPQRAACNRRRRGRGACFFPGIAGRLRPRLYALASVVGEDVALALSAEDDRAGRALTGSPQMWIKNKKPRGQLDMNKTLLSAVAIGLAATLSLSLIHI